MSNTYEQKRVSRALRGAQIGLAVTLFAVLAACGHKPIDDQSIDETPVAANEIVPTPDSEPTPVPGAENELQPNAPVAPVAPTAHKTTKSARSARSAKHRLARHHRAHKHTRVAHHRAARKHVKKAAAVGQIQNSPTPPPPTTSTAGAVIAPAPVIPAPTTLGALAPTGAPAVEEAAPSHRSWWLWSLVIGSSLALLVIFRAGSTRRSGRLLFNS